MKENGEKGSLIESPSVLQGHALSSLLLKIFRGGQLRSCWECSIEVREHHLWCSSILYIIVFSLLHLTLKIHQVRWVNVGETAFQQIPELRNCKSLDSELKQAWHSLVTWPWTNQCIFCVSTLWTKISKTGDWLCFQIRANTEKTKRYTK